MDGESTEATAIYVATTIGERLLIAAMLGYRFDDAIDDEDGGKRDGEDDKLEMAEG